MSLFQATIRNTNTKGQVNALRKNGEVPGIIYGGEDANEKISLTKKDVKILIKLLFLLVMLIIYHAKKIL